MLQYLFAAFSLKQNVDEGLTAESLAAVGRWRKTLLEIAEQEMLHLALVQNLLTAVGAAPRLARPNFPMPPYAYPAGVRIELLPFDEAALRHFAFLERPEGMDIEDAEGFAAIAQAVALPHDAGDEIVPHLQEFDTIGQLYRSIEAGLEHLADRLGAGAPVHRASGRPGDRGALPLAGAASRSPISRRRSGRSTRSSSRARAPAANGATPISGACSASSTSTSSSRRRIRRFEPSRPVVAANVRPQATGVAMPLITDPGTIRVHGPAQRRLRGPAPAPVALLRPHRRDAGAARGPGRRLGRADVRGDQAARRPSSRRCRSARDMPGVTAGPGFELFYQVDYLLPHREAAWVLMEERLRDAAAFAVRCGELCSPALMEPLAKVARSLERYADELLAAT